MGFSINIISLLGLVLAIGLVVDDAIVVVEAAQVNIERGMKSREAAIEAMRNVASPIVATTVVLLAVFIPMSFVGGISGRLFQQFAVTISVSVVLSAFNALTLSPALCALLLKPRKEAAKGFFAAFNRRFDRWLEGYSSRIAATVRHMARTAVLLLAIGCAIGAAWYFMPGGFLPEEDQGYVMVVVNAPEASSLRVTQEALVGADRIIRSLPEVQYTSYAAGFNMLAGIAETDSGVVFVKLVDYSDRKRSAMQIAAALNGMLYEGAARGRGLRLHPAVDSGSGRHVGPVGRYAGFGRARYGLPGRADGALPRFAAPPVGNRYGHHVVQRRRPAAKAGDRQSLRHAGRGGAERRLFGHNDLFGWCLHQQFQPFRKVVPDLSVGRTRLSDGPHVARQLFREERP